MIYADYYTSRYSSNIGNDLSDDHSSLTFNVDVRSLSLDVPYDNDIQYYVNHRYTPRCTLSIRETSVDDVTAPKGVRN